MDVTKHETGAFHEIFTKYNLLYNLLKTMLQIYKFLFFFLIQFMLVVFVITSELEERDKVNYTV